MLLSETIQRVVSWGTPILLIILTGCSQNPITDNDFEVDNARAQFQERREQTPPGQPLAVKPAEQKKIDRAVRVLRVFKGVGSTNNDQLPSKDTKDELQAKIEQSLNSLAEVLVQKIQTSQAAMPQDGGQLDPAQSQDPALIPTTIAQEGLVYLNSNQVIFEESILLDSFARIEEQGLAKSHNTYFAFSGLPLSVVLTQIASASKVNTIIKLPEAQEGLAISYEHRGSSIEGLDRLLTQQQLKVVWDTESKNAWIMSNNDYQQLIVRASALAESQSLKRQSLRSGNEQRELSELAARVQTAQLAIVRSGPQSFPLVLSDIESTFASLTPATQFDLIDNVTTLRRTWQLFETAPEEIEEAVVENSKTIESNSILEGSATIEETACLALGKSAKTVKIFMAYQQPKDVQEKLNDLKSIWNVTTPNAEDQGDQTEQNEGGTSAASEPEVTVASAQEDSCNTITGNSIAYDDQGLIVTASDDTIDLILNLLDGIDTARKQVLVEVYLVQVNADWRRQIELSFETLATNTDLASALGGNILNLSRGSTDANAQPVNAFKLQGQTGDDLFNLLTFLEQNDIGQTISSPSILALPGDETEKFSVKRTRTLKFQRNVPGETIFDDEGNPSTTTDPTVEWESKPLELIFEVSGVKVTPANNNVELLFSFKEDTIDSETTSPDQTPETRNEIETRILAAPGDVAVLAGLYRQSSSDAVTGLPGLTGNGVAAGLLGGSNSVSNNRSELLVFIAPTVLQPGVSN